jgi:hypothetical protein
LWLYSGKVQSHKRFARFEGVWVDQHEPGPHTLWPEALGLFVPLNILAFFVMKLKPAQTHFHIGLFAVFVVSNIIVFQPWEVDNTKLFYIWVFGASGHIGVLLERWWHALDVPNKRMGGPQVALKGFTALVYISLIFSGVCGGVCARVLAGVLLSQRLVGLCRLLVYVQRNVVIL